MQIGNTLKELSATQYELSPQTSPHLAYEDPVLNEIQRSTFPKEKKTSNEDLRFKLQLLESRRQMGLNEDYEAVLVYWREMARKDALLGQIASAVFSASRNQEFEDAINKDMEELLRSGIENRMEEEILLKMNQPRDMW